MVNIALIGTWHVHFKGYADEVAKNKRCKITVLWDEDQKEGKKYSRKYHCDYEPDYDRLLERPDVDAVLICAQTAMHVELIHKAAMAKKHIFTEKVLCFDTQQALELAQAIKLAQVEFCISFVWRARGDMLFIKRAVEDGLLGRLTYCRIRNAHDGAIARWLPETFFDPATCGGGAMMDLGAHPMYLLNWIMGRPKAVVSSFTHFMTGSVEDNAVSVFEYENGAIGVSETSFVAVNNPFSLEICGEKGSIFAGGASGKVIYNVGRGWRKAKTEPDEKSPLAAWIDTLTQGGSTPYSIDDAVELTRVMQAAYTASRENRRVEL